NRPRLKAPTHRTRPAARRPRRATPGHDAAPGGGEKAGAAGGGRWAVAAATRPEGPRAMNPPPQLTGETFAAFLKCPYKAYLKMRGESGEPSAYQRSQDALATDHRRAARQELLEKHNRGAVIQRPPSVPEAIQSGAALITDVTLSDPAESCRVDALERVD